MVAPFLSAAIPLTKTKQKSTITAETALNTRPLYTCVSGVLFERALTYV